MSSHLRLVLFMSVLSAVCAQQTSTVSADGFHDESNDSNIRQESWLKKNDRYVFIIVLGLLILAILIWYIVRSIKGMRRRLAAENQGHMMMVQNIQSGGGFSEAVPVDTNGFHKMPDYPQQPPQQQYTHRY